MDLYFTPYPRPLEIEAQSPLHPDIDYDQATAYNYVAPTSVQYVHFFALGNTGLNAISDIVAQQYPFKVGTGIGGSKLLFNRILEYYGSSLTEAEGWGATHELVVATTPAGAEALQTGRVDMAFGWAGIPSPSYMGVTFDLKILPVDDPGLIELFREYGYYETTIPDGTYPFVSQDIPTAAATSAFRPVYADSR